MMNNKIKLIALIVTPILFFSCSGGGVNCENDNSIYTDAINPSDSEFSYILNSYNSIFNGNTENKLVDENNIFVDFSDGVTKYALSNQNNIKLLQTFLMSVSNEDNINNYFELSDDSIKKYTQGANVDYFLRSGHKDSIGNYKMGAPLDKAINQIAKNNAISVLVTDGELYDKSTQRVSMEMWASKAFSSWFNQGNEVSIIFSDFQENNNGKKYNKHLYFMWFIPKNYDGKLYSNFLSDLDFNPNISYKKLNFKTEVGDIFTREYDNSQTPGTTTYNEVYEVPLAFLPEAPFEYIDLSSAPFNADLSDDTGLLNVIRNSIDEDGKTKNLPLLEKLFFDFNQIENYQVNDLKINVSNISDNFKSFKKNYYAKKFKPEILKNTNGLDSLDIDNYLVFNPCITQIDDEVPYDLVNKTQNDTINSFASMLIEKFAFSPNEGIIDLKDFLELDKTAGKVNEINDKSSKYETIIKFSNKFNSETAGFKNDENNIIKIDIVIDDLVIKPLSYEDLTWNKITEEGVDETLYRSLTNTIKNNSPKEKIIYTYYIEFSPFIN